MNVYLNMPSNKKKSPKGASMDMLKFCAALVVACTFIGFLTWRHAQESNDIRQLREDLKKLESERKEMAVKLHNANIDLEREMEGRRIMELSNSLKLGLRPPDPKQRIVQMDRKQDNRGIRAFTKMVGYNK